MNLPKIVVLEDERPEEEFVLKSEPTSIGRAPENTIQLPYRDVSRHHATVLAEGNGFKIVDRGSPNGLYVNGERVTERTLKNGDLIEVGRRKLVFRT
jgi:pSer/pThr/pTyr-binding forkhead associated (FHA) protein